MKEIFKAFSFIMAFISLGLAAAGNIQQAILAMLLAIYLNQKD